MGFRMTPVDEKILNLTVLKIDPENAVPSGFPLGNPYVPFQFPPRITSEGKEMIWDMTHDTYAWEPVAHWSGNSARKITVHFMYSVTDQPAVGPARSLAGINTWNIANVSKSVRNLKSYFTGNPLANLLPIFELQLYEHAPNSSGNTTTWRGTSVSIKHSDTIITDGNGLAYSLTVECDLSLEMVTNILKDDGVPVYNFANVPEGKLPVEWY